jgi:NADH-quinone oxidoreductase subunit G
MIIVGQGALGAPTAQRCWRWRRRIGDRRRGPRDGWNGFACCTPRPRASAARSRLRAGRGRSRHASASSMGRGARRLFLLGADEIDMTRLGEAFVVYIGTHGDAGRTAPTSSCRAPPTPREVGHLRQHRGPGADDARAAFPPGEAREDWAILRALSETLGQKLPFDSLRQLRAPLYGAPASGARSTRSRRIRRTRSAGARAGRSARAVRSPVPTST